MKKWIYLAVVVVVVLGGYLGVNALFTKSYDMPTTQAMRGELMISQKITGTVDAARAYTISAPRIRGLQITWMAPEGSQAKEGDPIIKFDATEQMAELTDHQSTLKIAQATLERQQQEYTIQDKNLRLEMQRAQRNYDEKKHEAPKLAEEARLELELAQLNFQAKLDQISSDVSKAELEVQRAQDKVALAQRELAQMTINAPIPGMVVYLEIWKGGNMGKVQEGDSPWPGQGLINLPDLSEMIVKGAVSEVDAAKVDSGQQVYISLDAIPDRTYEGVVVKKGTLARKKDYNSKINVFDVEVAFHEEDEELKPGMSASCRIVVDRLADVVKVPLESVFEKEGSTVVYLKNKHQVEVEVGRRSDMEIEILSGLEGNEQICLVDPTLDEPGLPGDRATEPELNKGRQPNGAGKAPRRGRNR
ncbi:MAG: efflux RND transporter periplasmic adaptor subunit [candidate division Zixibacteria bacterium]|nr:efflux RND transporter periplasmic adaptor subunit [candidate division Zixibacteria bacterium]